MLCDIRVNVEGRESYRDIAGESSKLFCNKIGSKSSPWILHCFLHQPNVLKLPLLLSVFHLEKEKHALKHRAFQAISFIYIIDRFYLSYLHSMQKQSNLFFAVKHWWNATDCFGQDCLHSAIPWFNVVASVHWRLTLTTLIIIKFIKLALTLKPLACSHSLT